MITPESMKSGTASIVKEFRDENILRTAASTVYGTPELSIPGRKLIPPNTMAIGVPIAISAKKMIKNNTIDMI